MAQFIDWLSRLFSPGSVRGLSGDLGSLDVGTSRDAYFYERMRLHRTDVDFIADPDSLWDAPGEGRRRVGLLAHLDAERIAKGERLGFTDVLLVVSGADLARARGGRFAEKARSALARRLDAWCAEEGVERPFEGRPFGCRVVEDGGPDMEGNALGLVEGEFVTALLPNVTTSPLPTSRPVIHVHLHLPGHWDDFREVGTLYDDQLQFTLGSHWLDNFHHPALAEPALYRLQQFEDGSFVHVIPPDLRDRYRIRSEERPGEPAVLTLVGPEDEPLAHIVLAMAEASTTTTRPRPPAGLAAPVTEDEEPTVRARAHRPAPARAPDPAAARGPAPSRASASFEGHHTIIPMVVEQDRFLTLRERGVLLQKVHFARFMEGYDVYVASSGRVATHTDDRAATFQVRRNRVLLVVHRPDVLVDGIRQPLDTPVPLGRRVLVEVGGRRLEYRDLSRVEAPGWPYLGEIRNDGTATHLVFGGSYRVGRDRRCRIALPDEPVNDNIVWLPGMDGTTVRSRSGDIPKSRFYTDSIMVASEHAELDLTDEVRVRCLARHCYTYVRRQRKVIALYPASTTRHPQEAALEPGDELLVGNSLFEVSYEPPDAVSATDLVRAAELSEPPQPAEPTSPLEAPEPPALSARPPHFDEVPAAAGLGERGAPPPPPMLTSSFDSILGVEPPQPARVEMAGEAPAAGARTGGDDPRQVVTVSESTWRIERARPARLVLLGWSVSGEVVVGNHDRAGVVLPEVRLSAEQVFVPRDYARLRVRGRRGRIELLDRSEARLLEGDAPVAHTLDLDAARLEVVRRDEEGEEDFAVVLHAVRDARLPDPRARLLRLDRDEPMSDALFTLGLPLDVARELTIGPIRARWRFDGRTVTVDRYLDSYQDGEGGFHDFLLARGDQPFCTFPERGGPVVLHAGDRVVAGRYVYLIDLA